MKKLCIGACILIGLSLYAVGQENMLPNINTFGTASIMIENKTGEDFIVYGDFTPQAYMLKKGAHIQLKFKENIQQKGPMPMFVRPNDLILYAQDPEVIEFVLAATTPQVTRLVNALSQHVASHVHFMLEGAGGLRRGLYTASPGDRITLEKGDVAQVLGKSNFPNNLRLKQFKG